MSLVDESALHVRKLIDGSWWASHPTIPMHGYGDSREDALRAWRVQFARWLRGKEVLAADPT